MGPALQDAERAGLEAAQMLKQEGGYQEDCRARQGNGGQGFPRRETAGPRRPLRDIDPGHPHSIFFRTRAD
jgi:hypothetical protein